MAKNCFFVSQAMSDIITHGLFYKRALEGLPRKG